LAQYLAIYSIGLATSAVGQFSGTVNIVKLTNKGSRKICRCASLHANFSAAFGVKHPQAYGNSFRIR
jgi:hypothetical protein